MAKIHQKNIQKPNNHGIERRNQIQEREEYGINSINK